LGLIIYALQAEFDQWLAEDPSRTPENYEAAHSGCKGYNMLPAWRQQLNAMTLIGFITGNGRMRQSSAKEQSAASPKSGGSAGRSRTPSSSSLCSPPSAYGSPSGS
jgi:hypothetical protein